MEIFLMTLQEIPIHIMAHLFWIAFIASFYVGYFQPPQISFSHIPSNHRWYKFLIGFFGAVVGWLCIYIFLTCFLVANSMISFSGITLLLVGVAGVAGFLPVASVHIVNSIGNFIDRLAKSI
jgi:hypothetical protein